MTTPTHSHKAWTDKGGHVTKSAGSGGWIGPPKELMAIKVTLGCWTTGLLFLPDLGFL